MYNKVIAIISIIKKFNNIVISNNIYHWNWGLPHHFQTKPYQHISTKLHQITILSSYGISP